MRASLIWEAPTSVVPRDAKQDGVSAPIQI